MTSLQAAKQQLRLVVKEKLSVITQEAAAAESSAVCRSLQRFRPFVEAKRISVFLSMPTGEIQTGDIVRHALESGKVVYVPYLYKNPAQLPGSPVRVMDMVRLKDIRDYESLLPDPWGIPSIDPATVHERQRILGSSDAYSDEALLDLILVPGVAFDLDPEDGGVRRLGHGKGFYDYFISRHVKKRDTLLAGGRCDGSTRPSALLYGLALSGQFLTSPVEGSVPVGPLDQRLDGLILGDGRVIDHAGNPAPE